MSTHNQLIVRKAKGFITNIIMINIKKSIKLILLIFKSFLYLNIIKVKILGIFGHIFAI